MFLCLVVVFNVSYPQTRKDSIVEQLASQGKGLAIMMFLYCVTWGFGYPAYIRYPDVEMRDYYPIFAIMNSCCGIFVFAFLGMSSGAFRATLLGNGNLKVTYFKVPLFATFTIGGFFTTEIPTVEVHEKCQAETF